MDAIAYHLQPSTIPFLRKLYCKKIILMMVENSNHIFVFFGWRRFSKGTGQFPSLKLTQNGESVSVHVSWFMRWFRGFPTRWGVASGWLIFRQSFKSAPILTISSQCVNISKNVSLEFSYQKSLLFAWKIHTSNFDFRSKCWIKETFSTIFTQYAFSFRV